MNKKNSVLLHHILFGGGVEEVAEKLGLSKSAVHRVLKEAKDSGLYDWKENRKGTLYDASVSACGEQLIETIKAIADDTALKTIINELPVGDYKKVVVLPDIHYPENINLTGIEDFLADYQPDAIIYLGDVLDLKYLSKFDQNNQLIAKDKLRLDYDWVMSMMDRHRNLARATDVYYIEGNHEFRVKKILESQPVGTGFVEIPEAMKLQERGIKWIEMNEWTKIGKLFFTHGLYYNMYHARKHVDTCQRNVIYGHTHAIQVHSGFHPYDKDLPHVAKSIGCLCGLNPAYMKNRPNQWMNSFYIAEIESDGTFTDNIIPVVNGEFRVAGLQSRRYTC